MPTPPKMTAPFLSMTGRAAGLALPWMIFLGTAGCGKTTTTVTGKVTYQGTPLTSGTVTFVTKDNDTFRGHIDKQGNYSVASIPVGPTTVTVESPPPAPNQAPTGALPKPGNKDSLPKKEDMPGASETPEPPSDWRKIPPTYSSVENSGLSYGVTKEANVYNIDLK